jgi:hypothetical protein
MSNIPKPPTIPPASSFSKMMVGGIKFNGTNSGNLGFFNQTPAEQQEPPTPVVNITTQSNYDMIQDIISTLTEYGLYKPITAPAPSGRTITFNNNSTTDGITIYLTVGAPDPEPATLIATLDQTDSYVWDIPETVNWSGNFSFWETGKGPAPGSTLFEIGLNQKWKGIEDLRDTFDISTVPPGIGDLFQNGPRAEAVAFSAAQGFTTQQSRGYSVGLEVVPPVAPMDPPIPLPTVTVTCDVATGNSSEAITYPNDTATPRQQTGYAEGNYIVNIINPVSIDIP